MAHNRPVLPRSDPLEEIVQLCVDLDLTTLATMMPSLLQDAEKQGYSFTQLALAMLRSELTARLERRRTRGL